MLGVAISRLKSSSAGGLHLAVTVVVPVSGGEDKMKGVLVLLSI